MMYIMCSIYDYEDYLGIGLYSDESHYLLFFSGQLQQLASQPNGQTRIENEQRLQRQKQSLELQLSQQAQQLLQMRLVGVAEFSVTSTHGI